MVFCLVVGGVTSPYTLSGPTTKKTLFICVSSLREGVKNKDFFVDALHNKVRPSMEVYITSFQLKINKIDVQGELHLSFRLSMQTTI